MENKNKNKLGYVYVMENVLFPGLVKIGKTSRNPEERAKNLDTGLPEPWKVLCAVRLEKYSELENLLHNLFTFRRLKKSREFFYFNYENDDEKKDIIKLFKFFSSGAEYGIKDATKDIQLEVQEVEKIKLTKKSELTNGKKFYLMIKGTKIVAEYYDTIQPNGGFLFKQDVPGIVKPSWTDSKENARRSAYRFYNSFKEEGVINDEGIFLLKDVKIPYEYMSRYTIVLVNNSVNWLKVWKDENDKEIRIYFR